MGQDIKINREAVRGSKFIINGLVTGTILHAGAEIVNKTAEALRESGGLGVAMCKEYMKQEQVMMESFGAGLDYMIEHIDMAAEDMIALDKGYTKKRIEE